MRPNGAKGNEPSECVEFNYLAQKEGDQRNAEWVGASDSGSKK